MLKSSFSRRLKNGDLQAYNELFKTHYSKLYNYAYKLSNDNDIAQDVVQESFIKLWVHRKNIKPHLNISNYLLKICRNEFLIYARKKKKYKAFLDQIKIETAYEVLVQNEQNINYKISKIEKAVNNLPPRCKKVIVLSKFENMKYRTIAKKMGISIKTVENHVSNGFVKLRKELK